MDRQPSILKPWMHWLLKFAGGYNLVAGLSMILFYHEGFKSLGIPKPEMNLPIQLVGMMVLLFGIGYLMVDRSPAANRNVLLLGLLSKLIGPIFAVGYVVKGDLPMAMLPILFFADVVYLVPFWMIYRTIGRREQEAFAVLGNAEPKIFRPEFGTDDQPQRNRNSA